MHIMYTRLFIDMQQCKHYNILLRTLGAYSSVILLVIYLHFFLKLLHTIKAVYVYHSNITLHYMQTN